MVPHNPAHVKEKEPVSTEAQKMVDAVEHSWMVNQLEFGEPPRGMSFDEIAGLCMANSLSNWWADNFDQLGPKNILAELHQPDNNPMRLELLGLSHDFLKVGKAADTDLQHMRAVIAALDEKAPRCKHCMQPNHPIQHCPQRAMGAFFANNHHFKRLWQKVAEWAYGAKQDGDASRFKTTRDLGGFVTHLPPPYSWTYKDTMSLPTKELARAMEL